MTSMLLIVAKTANHTLIDAFWIRTDEIESLSDMISSFLTLRILEAWQFNGFLNKFHSICQLFLLGYDCLFSFCLCFSLFFLLDLVNFLNLWLHNLINL